MKTQTLHIRKRLFVILGTLLLLPFYASSQDEIYDKVEAFPTSSLDEKIVLMYGFFENIDELGRDTLLYFVDNLHVLGQENYRKDATAMANLVWGYYLFRGNLFNEAREKYQSALDYYLAAEIDSLISDAYNYLGNVSFIEGDYTKALEAYYNSLKYGVKSGDKRFEMRTRQNLSNIYTELERYEEAEKELNEVLQFYIQLDESLFLSTAYANFGQFYLNQGLLEEAKSHFLKSAEHGFSSRSIHSVAKAYTNLAITNFYSEDYDLSEQYFRYALDYWRKVDNHYQMSESYFNLGSFYEGIEKIDSALVNYTHSATIARSSEIGQSEKDALLSLIAIYETLGQKDNQIEVLTRLVDLQEEMSRRQAESKLQTLELNHRQLYSELKNIGKIREEQLESRVDTLESVFNYWIIIVLLGFLMLYFLFIFMRKKIQKTITNENKYEK